MADPYGGNITDRDAGIAERSDYNLAQTKLPSRIKQLRTDVDAATLVGPPMVLSNNTAAVTLATASQSVSVNLGQIIQLTGHATNELTVTDVVAGQTLLIVMATAVVGKVKLTGGTAVTCAASKTTMLLATSPTALVTLTVSP